MMAGESANVLDSKVTLTMMVGATESLENSRAATPILDHLLTVCVREMNLYVV